MNLKQVKIFPDMDDKELDEDMLFAGSDLYVCYIV